MLRKIYLLSICCVIGFIISGCGQSGSLYLPPAKSTAKSAAAVVPAAGVPAVVAAGGH